MDSRYVEWLRRDGVPLFEGAGILWRTYRNALLPATTAPCFVDMSVREARDLLRQSGAWLVRYSSDPCEEPSEWWYMVCDAYDPLALSSKIRNEINRSRRRCRVDRIEADWLATHGFGCYLAAFGRYSGTQPVPEAIWRADVLRCIGGPVELWGVFVGSELAGYGRCVIEGNSIATTSIRLDPAMLRERTAYALISQLLKYYVSDQGKTVSNGNRAVAHETQFQAFLMKQGFQRQFCQLNVVYRRLLRIGVGIAYPMRRALMRFEVGRPTQVLRGLLRQEEWRRWRPMPRSTPGGSR